MNFMPEIPVYDATNQDIEAFFGVSMKTISTRSAQTRRLLEI